jgi:hypothetical protein
MSLRRCCSGIKFGVASFRKAAGQSKNRSSEKIPLSKSLAILIFSIIDMWIATARAGDNALFTVELWVARILV